MATHKRTVAKSTAAGTVTRQKSKPRVALQRYDENRAKFSAAKLRKYDGRWAAFSADGTRIVASAESIEDLEKRLAELGEDPEQVTFERIELATTGYLGGAELI